MIQKECSRKRGISYTLEPSLRALKLILCAYNCLLTSESLTPIPDVLQEAEETPLAAEIKRMTPEPFWGELSAVGSRVRSWEREWGTSQAF